MLTVTQAEVLDACFKIGEDTDRFSEASFALEFTDKLLPERFPAENLFDLLRAYLRLVCRRDGDFRLVTLSYMVKVMQDLGVFPEASEAAEELRTGMNDDIFNSIRFLMGNPLERMDGLTLDREAEDAVFGKLTEFARRHLDIGKLKSESILGMQKEVRHGNHS
jgi:recombinational DNA repair protein (RecF pathway)